MLVAVTMLRASGAVDMIAALLAPLVEPFGMPADCLPLALLRPFSGSGALAVGSSVMEQAGPDSTAGRVAAVMLGSSDTSF
jgi:spore maturation protein B